MAEEIRYRVAVDSKGAEQAIKSLNKETGELDKTFEDIYGDMKPLTGRVGELEDRMYELAQAGKTNTKEFRELSKEAARLKTVQREVDEAIDRTSRTLSQKFTAGMDLATGAMVVGQGALETFGVESKSAEESMAGFVKTLAIGQGMKQIEDSTGIFSKLAQMIGRTTIAQKALVVWNKAVTAATWLWNAALTANPLGAIIVAVTAVIAAGYALIRMFQDSAAEAEKLNASLDATTEALENQTQAAKDSRDELKKVDDQQLALAKAQGKSKDEVRKLEQAILSKNITLAEESQALALNTLKQQENTLAKMQAADEDEEAIKKQEDNVSAAEKLYEQETTAYKNALNAKRDALNRYQVEDAQLETNNRKKRKSEAQKEKERKAKEAEAERQKEADELAKKIEELEKYLEDRQDLIEDHEQRMNEGEEYAYQESIRAEDERYQGDLDKLTLALENKLLTQQEYNDKVLEAQRQHQEKLNLLEEEDELMKQEKRDEKATADYEKFLEDLENEQLTFEEKRERINERNNLLQQDETLSAEAKTELAKSTQQEISRVDDLEANHKRQTLDLIGGYMNQAAELAGQSTAEGKAISTAAALINTYAGMAQVEEKFGSPELTSDRAMKIAAQASILATGFKTIKSINSVKVPKSGGRGGSSLGSKMSAPTFNMVGQSPANNNAIAENAQAQIDNNNNNPVRAYVVSTDVSDQQAMDREIEGQSSL